MAIHLQLNFVQKTPNIWQTLISFHPLWSCFEPVLMFPASLTYSMFTRSYFALSCSFGLLTNDVEILVYCPSFDNVDLIFIEHIRWHGLRHNSNLQDFVRRCASPILHLIRFLSYFSGTHRFFLAYFIVHKH